MTRFSPLFILPLGLVAVPGYASTYSATLAAPATERFIGSDITWNCGAAACQGATDESRPVVLCESLAKKAGRIDSFIVDGRAFAPAELARCNASAKPQPGQPVAGK